MFTPKDHSEEAALRLSYLIAGFLQQRLSPAEHDELDNWIGESDANMRLFEELTDEKKIAADQSRYRQIDPSKSYPELVQRLQQEQRQRSHAKWAGWAIAASFLLLAGSFFLWRNSSSTALPAPPVAQTIQPGHTQAQLRFANGQVLSLDSSTTAALPAGTAQTPAGELQYTSTAAADYHTLSTPIGGQYQLILPDGTKVRLNASSSLSYPTQFNGDRREVQLTGEAFFDVVTNPAQPFFVVLADSSRVEVTGTQFLVQSYPNERMKNVALVEGKIKLQQGQLRTVLQPGQQYTYAANEKGTLGTADLDVLLGWTKEQFVFKNASIQTIMQQLQRWYNITVVYQEPNDQLFTATIWRHEPIEKLLQLLEKTNKIHFDIQQTTVYVLR